MVIFHGYVSHNPMGTRNQQGKSMLSITIQRPWAALILSVLSLARCSCANWAHEQVQNRTNWVRPKQTKRLGGILRSTDFVGLDMDLVKFGLGNVELFRIKEHTSPVQPQRHRVLNPKAIEVVHLTAGYRGWAWLGCVVSSPYMALPHLAHRKNQEMDDFSG